MTYGQGGHGKGAYKAPRAPARLTRRYSSPRPPGLPERKGPFRVYGKKASDLEYRIYLGLKRLGWSDDRIDFQVSVLGGRLPGGAVLDFVIWAWGGPIIVEPNGDHWHIATEQLIQRDKQRRAWIAEAWGRPFLYYVYAQGDLLDDDMAYRRLSRDVGRGG